MPTTSIHTAATNVQRKTAAMATIISFGEGNSGLQGGIFNGPVNAQFHHHAPHEQPETPPNPSLVIPFSRDADFVERGILDQIHQKCAVLGSRTALVGLGGVGKSQLAIEYAYRTRDRSPETWVFWVHASNSARFEQSFREFADRIKITGRQNPTANIFQLVHDWLCDEKKGKWALILDNVDDAGFLIEARRNGQDRPTKPADSGALRPLVSYLPQCQHGTILITTRTKVVALQLVEDNNLIAVEPMDKVDAVVLLEKKLGIREDSDTDCRQGNIGELAAVLEYMPLAIVQAAAYISQRAPRCSVSKYLDKFRKSDSEKTSLLDNNAGHLRRDREAKNSIIITWHISFEHIHHSRPSAADLLSLMSLFDRQGIPEQLVRHRHEIESFNARPIQRLTRLFRHKTVGREGRDAKSDGRDHDFEEDLLVLRNYAFISVSEIQSAFEMHALVQLAMRAWLKAKGDLERWQRYYCKILYNEFPTAEYENWVRCQELFPHAQSAAAQKPEAEESLKDWASLMYKAAGYAWRMGKGVEAENMAVYAAKVRKKILGDKHSDTLNGIAMVGLAYKLNGRWDEAKKLEVQVMKTRKTKFGVDHPFTLISMTNLASTYRDQGQWDEAKRLFVQVIEIRTTKFGVDHHSTLTSMADLASTYQDQGRWDKAEKLEGQVIEISKRTLGTDHPNTLNSMANLASTFKAQGRWDAAEELSVQVLELSKKKLGADHPQTLNNMANLASTYYNQGRWDAAEELFVQVMEIRKKKFGVDYPAMLSSMGNLAATYRSQGRWDVAEELGVQVIETSKKKLGADHPDTLTSMANLAATYRNQGRLDAAEELEVQVMETSKKKLGVDHPSTLNSMFNLGSTFLSQGRLAAAEELFVQVIEKSKVKLGVDHPIALTSMANLASTYQDQGRWDNAEQLQVQVMEISKIKLGMDHPDTLMSMSNLALTYRNQGRWDDAEELFVQAIETRKTKLGVDHPDTLTSMANLALTYQDQGRWDDAEKLQVQVMETRKTKLGVDHPDTLMGMNNLAFTWKENGKAIKAISLMEECVELRKRVLRLNHPHSISSCRALDTWKAEQEDVVL
ncbi:hypothetical protein BKA65DRAFT_569095 [Rhexocercosporidium sp. MPI-PUGE-AT-0058]|nr:hypothetical protein BKA65DRAFT_569095 [Rhexocercosporidium sp. MPI-PUGE-AT-0058]